ncbi:hypothetical protein B0H65DRAFT_439480 [Neurospora tetraspora]|uniref:Uncharacterized protein n=1 Tax=Neurospora tetraspora TaxID=94610 RepID=A0AAE0JIZ2_9PEZI|nr:hypothetical protein B0H65DRAFT_439480 [Neurospora tetraspora]
MLAKEPLRCYVVFAPLLSPCCSFRTHCCLSLWCFLINDGRDGRDQQQQGHHRGDKPHWKNKKNRGDRNGDEVPDHLRAGTRTNAKMTILFNTHCQIDLSPLKNYINTYGRESAGSPCPGRPFTATVLPIHRLSLPGYLGCPGIRFSSSIATTESACFFLSSPLQPPTESKFRKTCRCVIMSGNPLRRPGPPHTSQRTETASQARQRDNPQRPYGNTRPEEHYPSHHAQNLVQLLFVFNVLNTTFFVLLYLWAGANISYYAVENSRQQTQDYPWRRSTQVGSEYTSTYL